MFRRIRNWWRRVRGRNVYEMPARITTMVNYRDRVVIGLANGEVWTLKEDPQVGLVFEKMVDL